MAIHVVNGAQLTCTFGTAPSVLTVVPIGVPVKIGGQFAGNIMDHKPIANIASFAMCTSLANPLVASATAAALGTLTPQPCVPNTVAPWTTGSPTVTVNKQPGLTNTCTCNCLWAGVIAVSSPGQTSTLTA